MDLKEKHNHLARITTFLILMLFIWLMLGCKAKRIEHTVYKTDTIISNSIIKITEPRLTDLTIESPCDEFGNLKPFKYTFGTGTNKTTLKAVNDTIYLIQDIDSIVNSKIDTYKASSVKEKEIFIQYKNKKLMWYSIILNVLLLGWLFRKPLFRLLKPI
jgi:hypothetical protein